MGVNKKINNLQNNIYKKLIQQRISKKRKILKFPQQSKILNQAYLQFQQIKHLLKILIHQIIILA